MNVKSLAMFVLLGLPVFSNLAAASSDWSGRYIHYFENADYRRSYCVSVVQNDANTLTFSDWAVLYKNGEVSKLDMSQFPPNVIKVGDPQRYLLPFFKKAAQGED